MSMSEKVSVIVPSYNVRAYIEQCLDSILLQDAMILEVLCVDANSDDGTYDVLLEYQENNEKVHVLLSDKKSYGYQVNMALDKVKGEYISIIDSDDYVDENMYEKLVQIADKYNADYVKGNHYSVIDDLCGNDVGNPYYMWPKGDKRYNLPLSDEYKEELHRIDLSLWRGIYRADFIKRNGIRLNESAGAAYQDIGFMEQVLGYAKKCVYIENPVYYYRVGRPGSSVCSGRGLIFAQNEFTVLLTEKKKAINSMHGLLLHMVKAFIGNLMLMDNEKEFMENSAIKDAYDWLKKRISKGLEEGLISLKEFPEREQEFINIALYHPLQLIEENREKKELLERNTTEIKSKFHGEIYIFGAGFYGIKCLKVMLDSGINVSMFIDNDIGKQGKNIAGIPIKALNSLSVNEHPVYIANKNHANEIYDELKNAGYKEEYLYTYYE